MYLESKNSSIKFEEKCSTLKSIFSQKSKVSLNSTTNDILSEQLQLEDFQVLSNCQEKYEEIEKMMSEVKNEKEVNFK